jgi:hypothetical protein
MSEEKVHGKKGVEVENELYNFGRIQYNQRQSTVKSLQTVFVNDCLLYSISERNIAVFLIFSSSELTNIKNIAIDVIMSYNA